MRANRRLHWNWLTRVALCFRSTFVGTGETDPRNRARLLPLKFYDPQQFQYESTAVDCGRFGTTLLAMQTFDVIRAMDWLVARGDQSRQRVVLVGEGLGGVWALRGGCVRPQAGRRYSRRHGAFVQVDRWPRNTTRRATTFGCRGALKDFDLPDLVALAAPAARTNDRPGQCDACAARKRCLPRRMRLAAGNLQGPRPARSLAFGSYCRARACGSGPKR